MFDSDPVYRRRKKSKDFDYVIEGTWGNKVLEELAPRPGERQIIKYRPSAFMGTSLDFLLRNTGIKAAAVIGLVTEGCVEATVRDLEQYGYYPVVLRDCVASSDKQAHEAALLVMSRLFYDVVTSEDLLKVWRSSKLNCARLLRQCYTNLIASSSGHLSPLIAPGMSHTIREGHPFSRDQPCLLCAGY